MEIEKKKESSEIVSFNPDVPDVATLIELDGALLDMISGGIEAPDCPRLKCVGNCSINL
jgi:hypothetical protein